MSVGTKGKSPYQLVQQDGSVYFIFWRVLMNGSFQNIDPIQLLLFCIPNGAFAQQAIVCNNNNGLQTGFIYHDD